MEVTRLVSARPSPAPPAHDAPADRPASRGPLLLLLAGVVVAIVIVLVQVVHLSPSALRDRLRAAAPTGRPAAAAGVVHDLSDFKERFGDPPDATYGRLRIPSLGVDAPIGRKSVGKDLQLPDPEGPSDVAWYDFGGNKGLGGAPGAGHNAVFAGHVDRNGHVDYANVDYLGPGVFFTLERITPGDVIEVVRDGKTLRYGVVWAKDVPTDADWNSLFSSQTLGDSITIVTCGGEFDYDTHEYTSRLVVRAVRG